MLDKLKSYVSIVVLFQHKAVLFLESGKNEKKDEITIVNSHESKEIIDMKF